MIWGLFAILHSLFRAAFAETNRVFCVNGTHLNFWHAVFGLLFLVPFLPFIEWNVPLNLYVSALIVGLVLTAGSLMQLILTAEKIGRVSSMHVPLEVLFAFVIWFFITPGVPDSYMASADKTTMTALGYVLATVGLMRIRRNDMGWKGLMAIFPGAVALGTSAVLIKMVVPVTVLPHAAFTFVFVAYAIMALLMGLVLLASKEATKELFATKVVHAGVMTGVFSISGFLCFIFALSFAPNPAYPAILTMLIPVWLLFYHKLKKQDDEASPKAALVMILGAALLIGANL